MRYLASAVLGAVLAAGLGGLWTAYERPHCPKEDSCQVDYHDGSWHVTEVTP